MITHIDLGALKREIRFPYPVASAGAVHFYKAPPMEVCYTTLEVCLRLSSDRDFAVDIVNGEECRTPYPHVFYKAPGVRNFYVVDDMREAVFFIYSGEVAEKLRETGLIPEEVLHPVEISGELEKLIGRLNALLACSQEFSVADKIDLVCFSILEELQFRHRLRSDGKDEVREKVLHIASFIQMNPGSEFSITELARNHGFSERSFFRHWVRYMGETPARYVLKMKLERAAYLLSHTGMSVREIGSFLRFCDDNYFSTRFKAHFHCTPREYREKFRGS